MINNQGQITFYVFILYIPDAVWSETVDQGLLAGTEALRLDHQRTLEILDMPFHLFWGQHFPDE